MLIGTQTFPARTEDEARFAVLAGLVVDEDASERADNGNSSSAAAALGLDLDVPLVVIGALDADHAGGQVDVFPAEGHQLAAAKAGVEPSPRVVDRVRARARA